MNHGNVSYLLTYTYTYVRSYINTIVNFKIRHTYGLNLLQYLWSKGVKSNLIIMRISLVHLFIRTK